MDDKLLLGLEDLDEVSEDEQYEEELKADRVAAADRAHQRRMNWLNFKGMIWKRKRKKRAKKEPVSPVAARVGNSKTPVDSGSE